MGELILNSELGSSATAGEPVHTCIGRAGLYDGAAAPCTSPTRGCVYTSNASLVLVGGGEGGEGGGGAYRNEHVQRRQDGIREIIR